VNNAALASRSRKTVSRVLGGPPFGKPQANFTNQIVDAFAGRLNQSNLFGVNLFSASSTNGEKNHFEGSAIMISFCKPLKNKSQPLLSMAGAAGLFALLALPSESLAFSGPFAALSGSWSGAGVITMSTGNKERIRCRAKYDVAGSGSNLDLTLRCASDSFKFELQSNVAHRSGAVSGTWAETTRGVGGNLEGIARGSRIQVRVSGVLSAILVVDTNVNHQSISIEAPGSEMSAVAISLNRGK